MRALYLVTAVVYLVCGPSLLLAQDETTTLIESASAKRGSSHKPTPRMTRLELSAGTGFTAGVLTGATQRKPVLQLSAGYAISTRLSLGFAYGQAVFTPSAFTDNNGVVSQETTVSQHYGARLKGVFLRKQIISLYGGLQLGVTTSRESYAHTFPNDFVVEDHAAYLADRATPFFKQGPQVGAIGFMGISADVLPNLAMYAELGNNLALLSGGLTVKF